VIASYQGNRNPFIDFPDYARFIWGNGQPSATVIGGISAYPTRPLSSEVVLVKCFVNNLGASGIVKVFWGNGYDYLENELLMQKIGDEYSANIPPQPAGTSVYFAIQTFDGKEMVKSVVYNYAILNEYAGPVTPINEIQGTGDETPYYEQIVTTTGVVTSFNNFGYFLQDKAGARNGIYVYDPGRKPKIGDSLVITGMVKEYYFLTEISDLTEFVCIAKNVPLPQPAVITASQIGEDYEGVLVRIVEAVCTYSTPWENYDMWRVDDGTGTLNVHNSDVFEFDPVLNQTYTITGPLNFTYEEWKVELRWLQDVMNPVSIWESPEFARLEIFPNPASDQVNVCLPENIKTGATLCIFDLLGKVRMKITPEAFDQRQIINLKASGIEPGMYFLVLESEDYQAMAKIIVRNN